MKLTELEPQFLRHRKTAAGTFWDYVQTIGEAQGIEFLCPVCFAKNGGPVGTHGVICWSRSRGVPDDASPGPGRWRLDGTGYGDLSLNEDPGSRSVALKGGCQAHFFVTNGEIQIA
jgi:hypothetical protein